MLEWIISLIFSPIWQNPLSAWWRLQNHILPQFEWLKWISMETLWGGLLRLFQTSPLNMKESHYWSVAFILCPSRWGNVIWPKESISVSGVYCPHKEESPINTSSTFHFTSNIFSRAQYRKMYFKRMINRFTLSNSNIDSITYLEFYYQIWVLITAESYYWENDDSGH